MSTAKTLVKVTWTPAEPEPKTGTVPVPCYAKRPSHDSGVVYTKLVLDHSTAERDILGLWSIRLVSSNGKKLSAGVCLVYDTFPADRDLGADAEVILGLGKFASTEDEWDFLCHATQSLLSRARGLEDA